MALKKDVYYEVIKTEGGDYKKEVYQLIESIVCEKYIELSKRNVYQHIPFRQDLIEESLEEIYNFYEDLALDMLLKEKYDEVEMLEMLDVLREVKKKGVIHYLDDYETLLDEQYFKEKIEEYVDRRAFLLVDYVQGEIEYINRLEEIVW